MAVGCVDADPSCLADSQHCESSAPGSAWSSLAWIHIHTLSFSSDLWRRLCCCFHCCPAISALGCSVVVTHLHAHACMRQIHDRLLCMRQVNMLQNARFELYGNVACCMCSEGSGAGVFGVPGGFLLFPGAIAAAGVHKQVLYAAAVSQQASTVPHSIACNPSPTVVLPTDWPALALIAVGRVVLLRHIASRQQVGSAATPGALL